MGYYGDYEEQDNRQNDGTKMSYYERKKYEKQCRDIGEDNLMPLLTGTEMADLFSGARLF